MNIQLSLQHSHPWDVTPAEARAIQNDLRPHVVRKNGLDSVEHVAGIDVGFEEAGTVTSAAVVILSFPSLELEERVIARRPTRFPYVPGLLSFREVPTVLDALTQLNVRPDLLLCDGQGIAHPRRFGIASHIGVLTDWPSIGVAKSLLTGFHTEVPEARGAWVPIKQRDETIGAVLRTRVKVKPVYISIGHKISLDSAISYVMRCTTRYRLPETTRLADRLASRKDGTSRAG
ncbi:MAG TPA: deoxyribonuclease V [Gammaproteobacteria bacterium]|nr:deoxyribonuclease V [Gammaproteobacteria bacterium]